MAVIIDEFKVVVDKPATAGGPPDAPPPITPKSDLKPTDLRDLMQHEEQRFLRLWAH